MNSKKLLGLVVLLVLFSQSFLWSDEYEMQTIFEKDFDAEVEDVIFDSYEENGTLKFYPKVVILKHLDKELSQGDWKFYKKEVQLLNRDGDVVQSLWFPYWSQIGCSENGNYFYVWTIMREKPEPYDPSKVYDTKIKESSFAVYSDKGEMLWKKSPYETLYDVSYIFYISPKDGSVIECNDVVPYIFYDPNGNSKLIKTTELYNNQIMLYGFGFSKNWEYVVAVAHKFPMGHPKKNKEPRVLLIDSLLNLVWEKSLDEYIGNTASISSTGAYIYASGYTFGKIETTSTPSSPGNKKSGQLSKMTSSSGYLYNKKGDLLMKIPYGYNSVAFSSNERYLLIKFNPPRNLQSKKEIGLIDIKAEKILFEKDFRIVSGFIASDGTVAILRKIKPEVDQKQLEKMSVGEGRKYMSSLEQQAKWKICIFDKNGNSLLESDGYGSRGGKITWEILNWDGANLVLGMKDNIQNKVKITAVKLK